MPPWCPVYCVHNDNDTTYFDDAINRYNMRIEFSSPYKCNSIKTGGKQNGQKSARAG